MTGGRMDRPSGQPTRPGAAPPHRSRVAGAMVVLSGSLSGHRGLVPLGAIGPRGKGVHPAQDEPHNLHPLLVRGDGTNHVCPKDRPVRPSGQDQYGPDHPSSTSPRA
jgi:hypothetical protein